MTQLEVMAELEAPGSNPAGLAWTGRVLWNADYGAGTLFAIDLDQGQVVDRILCPGVLSGLAWDGQALWQGLIDEGWLRNINPETHDFDRTIVVEQPGRLSGVTWDGEQLWVISQEQGKLLAIDREGSNVRRQLPIPVAAGGLTYHQGHLWIGYPDRMVFRDGEFHWAGPAGQFVVAKMELQTGREVDRYPVGFLPLGLAWVENELWMSNSAQRKLMRARLID